MVNRPIIYRYLQGFLHPNGGWPWDFWTINSSELPLSSWHWPASASKERIRCGNSFKHVRFNGSRMCKKWTKPGGFGKLPKLHGTPSPYGENFFIAWNRPFWGPFDPTVIFQTASKSHYTEGPIWYPGVQFCWSLRVRNKGLLDTPPKRLRNNIDFANHPDLADRPNSPTPFAPPQAAFIALRCGSKEA